MNNIKKPKLVYQKETACWLCIGEEAAAFGTTPEQAYRVWKSMVESRRKAIVLGKVKEYVQQLSDNVNTSRMLWEEKDKLFQEKMQWLERSAKRLYNQ